MTANITPGVRMPAPLAEEAGIATHPMGPCSLCRRGVLRGQRYAQLVASGQLAHVVCVARMATPTVQTHGRANPGQRNIMTIGTNT